MTHKAISSILCQFIWWYQHYHIFTFTPEHKEYLEQFLEDFERILKQMIRRGIKERAETAVTEPLSVECIDHLTFAKTKGMAFQGRQSFLDQVKQVITEDGKG